MTRRIFLALTLTMGLLALTATGCKDDTPSTGAGGAAGGGKTLRIAVSIPAATHGWPAGVGWWAEKTIAEYPDITWEFHRASSAAEQASQIEAVIEKGINGLVVLPFDSDTPLPAIKRAKRQGIYVVSVDRGLREPVADVYIAGDNRAFGRKAAEFMAEKLGGKGNIVILEGMPVEINTERVEGFREVMSKHPEIKILDSQPGNWNRQDAVRVMQGFLTKYPKIDAVWASDDDMALGVEQALREARRQGEMWIFPGAGMKEIIKRVMDKDPLYPANVTYPPGMIAAGIHVAVGQLRDGDIAAAKVPEHLGVTREQLEKAKAQPDQKSIVLEVQLITPENAEKFYFPDSVY